MKWKDSCLNTAEHSIESRASQLTEDKSSLEIGWVLKKERKSYIQRMLKIISEEFLMQESKVEGRQILKMP
jgi:predicted site-specific integrase-resolvase